MSIHRLDDSPLFPAVEGADSDGLLAIGGDLRLDRLLEAYRRGIFPWPNEDLPLLWFAPPERMVLRPGAAHMSRSLRAHLRRSGDEVRFDTAFEAVIRGCARAPRPGQDGTWINAEMVDAYIRLHEAGYAHSVETWRRGQLVGGLYGISLGGLFFGESMFSCEVNASKVAFVSLCQELAASAFRLFDCQMYTSHLQTMGASLMPRAEFMNELRAGLEQPTLRGAWRLAGAGKGLVAVEPAPIGSPHEGAAASLASTASPRRRPDPRSTGALA